MDEPLSALDRKTRRTIWRELACIYERYPVSIILVSHDPEEIEALTQRTLVMNRGKIENGVCVIPDIINDACGALDNFTMETEKLCGTW
jgi:ABC-type sulfate/molybdate transport systems ATPase subunit